MNTVFSLCGVGICAVFAVSIIKELHSEYVKWIIFGFTLICIAIILPGVESAVRFINDAAARADIKYTSVMLRALGVTYLTSLASEICDSAGESKISMHIELVGKVEILVLTIPLFRDLLDMIII